MRPPDVVIAGAGLIGLACALECERCGLRVAVLERGRAGQEASWAAAGMLAAHDRANPPALCALAELSLDLYPAFLDRLADKSGCTVPIETEWALEEAAGERPDIAPAHMRVEGFRRIREQSLDPRKLVQTVLKAVRQSSIVLRESTAMLSYKADRYGVKIRTSGEAVTCGHLLDCTGAWSSSAVRPAKGQMLRVHAPGALAVAPLGNMVVRNPHIYMVPRLDGSVVIGATMEDAGFDKSVHPADLLALQSRAADLLPVLASAPVLESWAGLRPATADLLPLLGRSGEEQTRRIFVAAGHFRNGVLLAPATARIAAQLLLNETPLIDLSAFTPHRFATMDA